METSSIIILVLIITIILMFSGSIHLAVHYKARILEAKTAVKDADKDMARAWKDAWSARAEMRKFRNGNRWFNQMTKERLDKEKLQNIMHSLLCAFPKETLIISQAAQALRDTQK